MDQSGNSSEELRPLRTSAVNLNENFTICHYQMGRCVFFEKENFDGEDVIMTISSLLILHSSIYKDPVSLL